MSVETVTAIAFFSVVFGAGFYSDWLVRGRREKKGQGWNSV